MMPLDTELVLQHRQMPPSTSTGQSGSPIRGTSNPLQNQSPVLEDLN
jgi:hypothetical protein